MRTEPRVQMYHAMQGEGWTEKQPVLPSSSTGVEENKLEIRGGGYSFREPLRVEVQNV